VVVLDGHGGAGRLAGGYEAWEADRRARRTAGTLRTKPSAVRRLDRYAASAVTKPANLSALRARFRQVEKDMAPLGRKRTTLEARLTATDDHRELASIGAELATAVEALGRLEEEWLALGAEIEDLTA